MIKKNIFAVLFISIFKISAAQAQLSNQTDSLSYAIGVSVGQSLLAQDVQPNMTVLSRAIQDVLAKSGLVMPEEACGLFIQNYFQQKAERMSVENLKKGEDFLALNRTKAGVITTESGLQYEVITEGQGDKPLASDKVKVHYHGTLLDGTVFDSSVERGTPATFGVTQVIQGWIEALQMMPAGSKWRLFIPADLAYGPRGHGKIGPNSTLIFDVELLEIVK